MTAAEKSFRIKVASATGAKDWPTVSRVFSQYGTYLELVGNDAPIGEKLTIEWSPCTYSSAWTDEVGPIDVCRIHGVNSRHEPGSYRPCLALDPYPDEVYSQSM